MPENHRRFRRSHPEVIIRKGVLKICGKFTGGHPCPSVISIKLLCNFHSVKSVQNTEFFLVRIFPHSDWIRRDAPYFSVFSPNAGKYGPEKTPYLDTFHAAFIEIALRHGWFPVYLLHIFRTPFTRNTSGWLLLKIWKYCSFYEE